MTNKMMIMIVAESMVISSLYFVEHLCHVRILPFDRTLHILYRNFDLASYLPLSPPRLSLFLPVSSPAVCLIFPNDLTDCVPFNIRHLLRSPSTGRRMHSCITQRVILPPSLRYRLLSETRGAVCLILGPVFVLWQEGEPEGSDQSTRLFRMA